MTQFFRSLIFVPGNNSRFLEKAKNLLLSSRVPVSEIAFDLGFEYPQHFSKLFKTKTESSPSEYRNLN